MLSHCKLGVIAALLIPMAFAQDVVQPGLAPGTSRDRVPTPAPNAYIVTFRTGTPKSARALAALQSGAQLRFNLDNVAAVVVTVSNAAALNALRNNPAVLRAVPDYVVRTTEKPSGTSGGKPGGGGGGTSSPLTFNTRQIIPYEVQRIGIPGQGNDGTGIGVAVVDTGIDSHPDLAPSSSSFTAFGSSCQDDHGHATHVSGLIAALNNEIAIVGVAPGAKLYCVKVLDATGSGTDGTTMAGLDWVLTNRNAVTPPIRVVNLSLGRSLALGETLENTALRPIIQALYNAGVVVVAAAGNSPDLEVSQFVPAGLPEVISVASTVAINGIRTCYLNGDPALGWVPADTASGFTTDGPAVTISAPGEEHTDIVNLGSAGCVGLQYGAISTTRGTTGATRKVAGAEARGTSFAAPLVSGVVARIIQKLLVPATGDAAEVEGIRSWITANASRKNEAPLDHPWANVNYPYTYDGKREGIAQAPK
ncbi:MAG: S8 family serine peptidase [Acidobacteriia bacterium]|nr:S8 family serine peptidase [Terriglobia bacterium]